MATTSDRIALTQGAWTELAAASGANVVLVVEYVDGRNIRIATDDASGNIPADFPGMELVSKSNKIATILIEDGEKAFAYTKHPGGQLLTWARDEA